MDVYILRVETLKSKSSPVALPIGLIVLLIVCCQVSQAKAIMGSHKVDGVLGRSPPLPLAAPIVGPPLPFGGF